VNSVKLLRRRKNEPRDGYGLLPGTRQENGQQKNGSDPQTQGRLIQDQRVAQTSARHAVVVFAEKSGSNPPFSAIIILFQ